MLRRQNAEPPPRPEPPAVTLEQGHLFWLDTAYTDVDGKAHVMGGAAGQVELVTNSVLPLDWLKLLILGQYTGIGQRTAFGWGRYRLSGSDGAHAYRRGLPAASLLLLAQDEANLHEAFRHIQSNCRRPATRHAEEPLDDLQAADWLPPETDSAVADEIPLERLCRALDQALGAAYRPPPLQGFVLPKANGGVRPLAVPKFFDRVLQRAVAQVLTPALEHLQYRHSYGFRPGRSRFQARDVIQRAYREGYRWVFESDIADFFDCVDWQRLEIRLRALYDQDPLVNAILAWMSAAVDYQGISIERQAGLPQGSPLSPAMANLMLDDFDSDMETLGFRLVRFADDFVVLCKTREQAEQAEQAARLSLAEHGLQLNADKTRIAATEQGFRYLGYLFINDTAVDVSGHPPETDADSAAPPRSWLARIGQRPVTPLRAASAPARIATDSPHPLSVGTLDEQGLLLCITGDSTCLSTQAKRLCVTRGKDTLHELPWNTLQAVVLFGRHHLTAPAVQAALQQDVPIHFASSLGSYQGVLWQGQPKAPGHALWLKQANLFADEQQTLPLAKVVVIARIRHQRETLRQRGLHEAAERLKQRAQDAETAINIASLHGFEGSAGRDYLQAIGTLLPDDWGFSGRNRQPPLDPFNALLSLGYTLLYGYAETLLRADGLLPWLGFYHQPHGSHATLASDLMEPFRHLVERTALTLVQRRELTVKDFFTTAQGACRLQNSARRDYLAKLLERLNTPLTAVNDDTAQTPLQHLQAQNRSLMAWLYHGTAFQPWRSR